MIQLLEAARVTVDKGTQGTNANTEEEEKNGRVNEDRNRKGEDGKEGGGEGGGDQIKKQSWWFVLEVSMEPPRFESLKHNLLLIEASPPLGLWIFGTTHVTNALGPSLLFLHILSRVTAVREGISY